VSVNTKQNGFTIVELTVSITAGSIVALAVLSISLFFFADVMRAGAQTELQSDAQTALNRVVEDMRTGSAILTTNTITDANEPGGGWNTSNTDLVLIVSTPSVNSSGNFIFDSGSGNPYQDEFIYFTDGNTLYKRILSNPTAPDNSSQTTCPAAAATSSCREDRKLTDNFEDMSFVFYDQNNNVTTDPTLARSAQITIQMYRQVFGRDVSVENNVRMSLRNPNS